ncbi:MAG TPA: HAMP domain-containing sensor histidine kinase [Microlunatus sp.]
MTDTLSFGSPPAGGVAAYRPLGRGTLGRQLVVRVAVLVAVVALLLSAATTVAVQQILMAGVRDDLYAASEEVKRDLRYGNRRDNLFGPGQSVGTFAIGFFASGASAPNGKVDGRGRGQISELPVAAAEALRATPPNSQQQTVTLPELGRYRVVAGTLTITETGEQGILVIGVPLAQVDRTLLLLMAAEAGLIVLAIGLAIIASRTVVQRSLRPLNRVAATAQQVSQLPLDRGEVALAVRVPPEDTNPASEVGQVGLAINHMLNNVESALAARQASETKVRQFVADASHELRNPLAAIRGYAELTRRSGEAIPPDTTYAIGRVESEAARMSTLVEDLLLLARLDAGPALDIQPTDLTELVINAVSDAGVAGPDHAWSLALPDEPVVVWGDAHRLHQVIVNLLANARTHTPPGTQVEAALSTSGGQAVMTVTDNGPGVPPDLQAQVFERFTRADTSRVRATNAAQGGSTGLGLAIVAAVVEAHHGQVAVDSHPGHTRFTVTLPTTSIAERPDLAGQVTD